MKVEKSEQQVSSLCSGSGCKHAAKQCKHFRGQSSSSHTISNAIKAKRRSSLVKSEQLVHIKRDNGGALKNRDNGLKSPDIGTHLIINLFLFYKLFDNEHYNEIKLCQNVTNKTLN